MAITKNSNKQWQVSPNLDSDKTLYTAGTIVDSDILVKSAKSVAGTGSATTPTASGASTSTSLSGTTLTVARSVTPTVVAGYVSSGTAGTVTITGTVPTQEKTVTSSNTDQTVTPDTGKLLSKVTVNAMAAATFANVGTSTTDQSSTSGYIPLVNAAGYTAQRWMNSLTIPASKTLSTVTLTAGTETARTYLSTLNVNGYTTITNLALSGVITTLNNNLGRIDTLTGNGNITTDSGTGTIATKTGTRTITNLGNSTTAGTLNITTNTYGTINVWGGKTKDKGVTIQNHVVTVDGDGTNAGTAVTNSSGDLINLTQTSTGWSNNYPIMNLYNHKFRNRSGAISGGNFSAASESNGTFSLTASGTDLIMWTCSQSAGNAYSDAYGPLIEVPSQATSLHFTVSNTNFTKNYITYWDSNKKTLNTAYISIGRDVTINTSTFPAGTKYISFRVGYGNATVGTTYTFTIMVNWGSMAQSWIPYYEPNVTSGSKSGGTVSWGTGWITSGSSTVTASDLGLSTWSPSSTYFQTSTTGAVSAAKYTKNQYNTNDYYVIAGTAGAITGGGLTHGNVTTNDTTYLTDTNTGFAVTFSNVASRAAASYSITKNGWISAAGTGLSATGDDTKSLTKYIKAGAVGSSDGAVSGSNATLETTNKSNVSVTGSGKGKVTTAGWINANTVASSASSASKYLNGITLNKGYQFDITNDVTNKVTVKYNNDTNSLDFIFA